MRVCGILLGLAAMLAGNASAQAQTQAAIYAQGTGSSLRFQGTPQMYGGSFGLYYTKQAGPVQIGPDIRGGFLMHGEEHGPYTDTALDTVLFGLRVAAAPGVLPLKLTPYAEALIGYGYWRGGVGVTRQDSNHMLVQAAAGVDLKVSQKIDWRVAEFGFGRLGAMPGAIYPLMLSTGIVIRVP